MRNETIFQVFLIVLATIATLLFGSFLYREIYPEYKIYQSAYVDLEKFRSSYTGQAPPPFTFGVKQIVIPKEDKGPETIDRCISCHVALQYEHFSPTIIAKDVNGNILYDKNGIPIKEPNPNYIWKKLDEKIADLRNPELNEVFIADGNEALATERMHEADKLESLKVANVGEHEYNMEKVLVMHPLIGRETRPFEYHPVDEYGCTVCHSGNGRGLVTDRAHGPVYDGTYEESYQGPVPEFLETDQENDPPFSKAYNHKPGHRLLFQTEPLLVDNLIQAKCVQCHKPTDVELKNAATNITRLKKQKEDQLKVISTGFEQEYNALVALLSMRKMILAQGVKETLSNLRDQSDNYELPQKTIERIQGNIQYLGEAVVAAEGDKNREEKVLTKIDRDLLTLLGTKEIVELVQKAFDKNPDITKEELQDLLQKLDEKNTYGSLHKKLNVLSQESEVTKQIEYAKYPLSNFVNDDTVAQNLTTNIDRLTLSYKRGKELFISQACYACHKISGFARGGIGPELTEAGLSYPWFIKESIVWPQADLKTSTMPNYRLDHEEVEDLMTFLLAQRPDSRIESEVEKRVKIQEWEGGAKLPFEEPVSPNKIKDVRSSMMIFATEGCAACHRLKGFKANVGFSVEKDDPTFDALFRERQWFRKLFPEDILGSTIVQMIDENAEEIDKRISPNVRSGTLLEEIEKRYPGLIASFYSNFKFALRAKNHHYEQLAEKENDPDKKNEILKNIDNWKIRVNDVLLMFVQEYGLGRQIGPKPNWSGVYRTDQWLMEHFWNPSSLIARSIMPVFPFDNTKFLALTNMLDVLGRENTNELREIWNKKGFNPEMAYETLCAQCHGEFLKGNGPVSEWIYPIPKNLGNPVFLRNLTKERAVQSIIHGVLGGPMPPWGEAAPGKEMPNPFPVLNQDEIIELVDWLYRNLPGKRSIPKESVPKWKYTPEDVIRELKDAGDILEGKPDHKKNDLSFLPRGDGFIASLTPVPSSTKRKPLQVEDVFTIIPNPLGGPEKESYYIKEKYYTTKNLEEGKKYFELNCSICHGKDADGAGLRSGVMEDAKPRKLNNLPWIETRDDLRLLRSLVYGVPGTSMIAWGDQTTSLQRLQLIMYIRSLTKTKRNYEGFSDVLYDTFQNPVWSLQNARSVGYEKLIETEKKASDVRIQRQRKEDEVRVGKLSPSEVAVTYAEELSLMQKVEKYRDLDQRLLTLISLMKKEKDLYQNLGNSLFTLFGGSIMFEQYLHLIKQNEKRFVYKEGKLVFHRNQIEEMKQFKENLVSELEYELDLQKNKKNLISGKVLSQQQKENIQDIDRQIKNLTDLKRETISTFSELMRIKSEQNSLYNKYQKDVKLLDGNDDEGSNV